RHRARSTLVVVQVALALVLLVSSGLMIRSFQALRHVQPGFTRPEEVQTLRISIPSSQVKDPVMVVRMEQDIVNKIAAIPGARSAGRESVGVVSDERDDGVHRKAPTTVLWPILMTNFTGDDVSIRRSLAYVIRSSRTGSNGFINEVSRAVWSVNPNLPLAAVRTLQEIYDASLARTSFTLVMLAI